MDNTQGLGAAKAAEYARLEGEKQIATTREKLQEYDKRIRELELQVHALTAAVQQLLTVTKPLVEIAEAASQQGRIVLE